MRFDNASPKTSRKVQIIACETIEISSTHYFWTSNFDEALFLSQLTQERVIYFKRKPYDVVNACSKVLRLERFLS